MRTTYFLYVAFLITVAVSHKPSYSQVNHNVNLAEYNKKGELKLSSIAHRIEYIPLETTPYCILGSSYKVELTKEFIFIFDYSNLYRFSTSGQFLNKIGKNGKGPGEFIGIGATFVIDDSKKEVFLLDYRSNRVLAYTYDGQFIRDLKLRFDGQFMSSIDNKYIIHYNEFFTYFVKNKPTYEFEIIDFNGKQINKIESTLDRTKKYGLLPFFPHFYQYNNLTHYKHPLNDTIFTFNGYKEKKPHVILNPQKYKRDAERRDFDMNSGVFREEKSLIVTTIEENDEYIFIEFLHGELYRLAYNKTTKESTNCFTGLSNYSDKKREATYTKGLVNDIDGGFPFWPSHIQGSTLIDFRYAYEFQFLDSDWYKGKEIRNKTLNANLKKLTKTINENDNPVLIIVR